MSILHLPPATLLLFCKSPHIFTLLKEALGLVSGNKLCLRL